MDILIDGGSMNNFIAKHLVEKLCIQTANAATHWEIRSPNSRQWCSYACKVILSMGDNAYSDEIVFDVADLPEHEVILGQPWLRWHNPLIDWIKDELCFMHNGKKLLIVNQICSEETTIRTTRITMITAKQMNKAVKKNHVVCLMTINVLDSNDKDNDDIQDWSSMNRTSPKIQNVLDEFQDVFPTKLPVGLPPERTVDHVIDVIPGSPPAYRGIIPLSTDELMEVKTQLDHLLEQGFICVSKSPYGTPVLFIKKKDGSLRMCMDYHALNKITIKNWCLMPCIDESFNQLSNASIFSKIDLASGYHQIRIRSEDILKIAFQTCYGHFKFTVVSFGLTNAPTTFTILMNDILWPFLDKFVVVYIDNILIYSNDLDTHINHIWQVLTKLCEHRLYAKWSKCYFALDKIEFLGHIISKNGIRTDPGKVDAIVSWPIPSNIIELQRFLGIANYYCRFVEKYVHIAAPLYDLLKNDNVWCWNDPCQIAFEWLKQALTQAPCLKIIDNNEQLKIQVHMNASVTAIGDILLQQEDECFCSIAYHSQRLNSSQLNYPIHEKEMLAIISALDQWSIYLQNGINFTIVMDHESIKYLDTQLKLSRW